MDRRYIYRHNIEYLCFNLLIINSIFLFMSNAQGAVQKYIFWRCGAVYLRNS